MVSERAVLSLKKVLANRSYDCEIDAAERAMREPLPAHKRAEILVRVAGALGRRHEEAAKLISDEAGKPLKAARVEASRAMSTYTFAAVEARKLTGETVPMDASAAGEGKLAFTLRVPIGVIGAISPFNLPRSVSSSNATIMCV